MNLHRLVAALERAWDGARLLNLHRLVVSAERAWDGLRLRRRVRRPVAHHGDDLVRKFMGGNLAKLMNVENTPVLNTPATA